MSSALISKINTLKDVIQNKAKEFKDIKGLGDKVAENNIKLQIRRMKKELTQLNKQLKIELKFEKSKKKGATSSRK